MRAFRNGGATRAFLVGLVLTSACGSGFTVTIKPTTPEVYSSHGPSVLRSHRVRVVDAARETLASRDGVTLARTAAAATAAESALLGAGWQPVGPDDSSGWTSDDRRDDAQLVIRTVLSGVDRAHPIDGCLGGHHFYSYWVEVHASLLGTDDEVRWTAHATARSTDLLDRPARALADSWESGRCDRLVDPAELHPLLFSQSRGARASWSEGTRRYGRSCAD